MRLVLFPFHRRLKVCREKDLPKISQQMTRWGLALDLICESLGSALCLTYRARGKWGGGEFEAGEPEP